MIDQFTIKRVTDAANIVDVLLELGYDLTKSGKDYECLCPFHEDRHLGSFKVSEAKNLYKCFACNASGDAVDFLMDHEGMNFFDAIRWLGRKYNIDVEGSEKFKGVKLSAPHTPPPPKPMLTLDRQLVLNSMRTAWASPVVKWMAALPWDASQRAHLKDVLWLYCVGAWKDGRVMWWQVDEQGRPRTAKIMRYLDDGHRDKSLHPGWVHNYAEACASPDDYQVVHTLFGMHLTHRYPTAEVNIVESEKTALLASVAWHGPSADRIFVASGGKGCLKADTLAPLIEARRKIVLWPDKDGVEEWKGIAECIGYDRMTVNDEFLTKYWKEEDGPKADLGDLITRWLMESAARQGIVPRKQETQAVSSVIDEMAQKNPALKELINTFQLTQV